MTTACVLVAAGRGERMGPGAIKALRLLAGEPLVVHAARAAIRSGVVDLLVVAAPATAVVPFRAALASVAPGCVVVAGRSTRRESVAATLAALSHNVDIVLVHDAARCLAPPDLFASVTTALTGGADAVVPVWPVADTVKRVEGDFVVTTLDRSSLRATQTPQGFRRDVLVRAHATVTADVTDDAVLVERLGVKVHVVPGHEQAFKVTRPLDLLLAEAVLAHGARGTG